MVIRYPCQVPGEVVSEQARGCLILDRRGVEASQHSPPLLSWLHNGLILGLPSPKRLRKGWSDHRSPIRTEYYNLNNGRGIVNSDGWKILGDFENIDILCMSFIHLKHLSSPKERTHTYIAKKHRKNCECCPGHYLIVNHYSSMSWFKFRNLSEMVNCVTNSLNHS